MLLLVSVCWLAFVGEVLVQDGCREFPTGNCRGLLPYRTHHCNAIVVEQHMHFKPCIPDNTAWEPYQSDCWQGELSVQYHSKGSNHTCSMTIIESTGLKSNVEFLFKEHPVGAVLKIMRNAGEENKCYLSSEARQQSDDASLMMLFVVIVTICGFAVILVFVRIALTIAAQIKPPATTTRSEGGNEQELTRLVEHGGNRKHLTGCTLP